MHGRGFLVAGVLILVALLGLVAWLAQGDDARDALERSEERFPSPTTIAPPTTVAATTPAVVTTGPAPATAAPTNPPTVPATVPPTEPPTLPPTVPPTAAPTIPPSVPVVAPATVPGEPGVTTTTIAGGEPDDPDYIGQLVPNVAAFTEYLSTPELAKAQIDQMLASGRHDVAAVGPVATICASVPMNQPLAVRGRWERDGRRIATSDQARRDAPGFGECLSDGGAALEEGSYQYVVIDSYGHESAAGGIDIGAPTVAQRFTNDGTEAICSIRIAPSSSRYFEVYVFEGQPVAPGSEVVLTVADVPQDVETVGCGKGGEVLATFSFDPSADTAQSLQP